MAWWWIFILGGSFIGHLNKSSLKHTKSAKHSQPNQENSNNTILSLSDGNLIGVASPNQDNNTIKRLSDGKLYELNQFIQHSETNEIKKINILYWKLKFIKKTNPEISINIDIDKTIEFTHNSYAQLHKEIINNQEISYNQKTVSPEILIANKHIHEWITNLYLNSPPANPIYSEVVNESLINSDITDKVAFANYLTDNKFDILSTESLFLNRYTDIIHKYDLIALPPLPQQWNVYNNANNLATDH